MRIAIEGCAHGELENIYETIKELEQQEGFKVDLLLCCGDFQATRNMADLQTMAVSQKYRHICTFYKYYSGELQAPILTVFIGGNHEASNHLQELPYGGWVAPNIYYLGYAGVLNINGLRIAGLSGIYKGYDYLRGHHEYSPFNDETKRSVYHVRQLEVFRLKQLSGQLDIFLSHDWPRGICNFGCKEDLLRFKPFLKDEIHNNTLGSSPCEELLHHLKPLYWFAAHMHCKFAAIVPHSSATASASADCTDQQVENSESVSTNYTKFLALDKCLPNKRFLQIIHIESPPNATTHFTKENKVEEQQNDMPESLQLEYDLEWLTILYLTNHLLNVKPSYYYLPNEKSTNDERYNFTPTLEEMQEVREKFNNDLRIPENFCKTAEAYNPLEQSGYRYYQQPRPYSNSQTKQFCKILGIDDPLKLIMLSIGQEFPDYVICNNAEKCNDDEFHIDASMSPTGYSELPDTSNLQLQESNNPPSRELSISHNSGKNCSSNDANLERGRNIDDDNDTDVNTEGKEKAYNMDEDAESLSIQTQIPIAESKSVNESGNLDKPPVKKFKIRNQDIYRTQSDDT